MDAHGNHLAGGERGEVVIQGPNVVSGYENNPEANATSFTNGWFRTGDQGFLDPDGYLMLTGRIKELINRGGEKIAPRKSTKCCWPIRQSPKRSRSEFPHATWGEEVAAAVVLQRTAQRIRHSGVLPRAAGGFQVSQEAVHRGNHPANRDRENPAGSGGHGACGKIAE